MSLLDTLSNLFGKSPVDLPARFDIVRDAIQGTMSKFHMAIDRKTKKTVGLKILDTETVEKFESRFKLLKKPSEGEIAMQIQHPRVVETFEFGRAKDGRQFIVMEYLEGSSLNIMIHNKDKILRGKRHILIRQMAEALGAVHKAGFIHRDICPRNFICAQGADSVKLIDFGLTLPALPAFMQPGNRTGTPLYLAPEIVRRKTTDQKVDLFAFGVSCYQLCTFDFPWPGSDATGRGALQHDSVEPAPILDVQPKLNKSLGRMIMNCLEAEPSRRPANAEAILWQIRNVTSDKEQGSSAAE